MPERQHLIVVIPGIGGSVLVRPADDKVVWDAGFADIADLVFHPERTNLAENPRLTPRGLIRSKRLLPGWTVIDGYEGLWRKLRALPGIVADDGSGERVPGANLVAFGYDFRRSIVEAAELLAAEIKLRLADLGMAEGDPDPRVIVVAHSMGGLVARIWLGPMNGWPQCRSLITLGTPHRGAPKALDFLVNGVRLRGRRLSGASELLAGWDSPYELLPRYPCIWDSTSSVACYPHELELPVLSGRAQEAFTRHEEIAAAWRQIPRAGTEMVVRLGYSHPTLSSATWDGLRLVVTRKQPTWLALQDWEGELGDGTVPAISALPIEMDGWDPTGLRVQQTHGRIGSLKAVTAMIEAYEGRPAASAARGDEKAVALGVEVDEIQPAHATIPVRARLHAVTDADAAGVVAIVRIHDQDGVQRHRGRLAWDTASSMFVGELPGQPPGMYDVRIEARTVPGGGDLATEDSVAVIEADHVG